MFENEQRFRTLQSAAKSALTQEAGVEILGRHTSYFLMPVTATMLRDDPLLAYRVDCYTYLNPNRGIETVLFVPDSIPPEIRDLCAARRMVEELYRFGPPHRWPIYASEERLLNHIRTSGLSETIVYSYARTRKKEIMMIMEHPDWADANMVDLMVDLDKALEILEEAESALNEKVFA